MDQSNRPVSPPLSTATLVSYGLSSWPLAALAIGVFVYLPKVYDEATTISMGMLGLVFLLVRLWDMVSDPLIGWLSDRTRSRFGRRRPWVIAAWIPMSVAIVALCTPPQDATYLYLLVWSLVFFTAGTALYMPYTAWGAELSDDYHDRNKVFAWRHVFAAVGTLSAVAMLTVYDPQIDATREAQAIEVLVNFGVALLPLTLLVLFVKVPDPLPPAAQTKRVGWARGLATIRANGAFRILLSAYFLNGLANALPATLFLYYVESVLQADVAVPGLLLYFGLAIVGTPIWVVLSRRWGKHRTWRAAMLISAVAYLPVPLIGPGDTLLFFALIGVAGVTLGADLTLPGSMQADVVDQERADQGQRRTGVYFALWGMVAKMALALGVGISFPVLGVTGFDIGASNEAGSLAVLVVLFATLPMLLKIAAALVIRRYPLTQARHDELQAKIAGRRAD